MKIYQGINALSLFQKKELLNRAQKINPGIKSLSAEYNHFVDLKDSLTTDEEKQLRALLNYGSPFVGTRKGAKILIVPRPGTISPWSSKATDIINNSGLNKVVRAERGITYYLESDSKINTKQIASIFYDRMTEIVISKADEAKALFTKHKPRPLLYADIIKSGKRALVIANSEFGLALEDDEIDYLYQAYKKLSRNPSDAELMMFAQVNSEHCRHKIFNADWIIDGKKQPKSLFKMIKNTYEKGGQNVLSAYSDNAAVLKGPRASSFLADPTSKKYSYKSADANLVIKVETHNHPTAIAPFPGAATGAGGEIRDEGATGRGARPKMGLTGYTVSNLQIPSNTQPWEIDYGRPSRISSALDIMIESPLGGAAFNNEFGRPNLSGYFRTYESDHEDKHWGYHKPIMIAGGVGSIESENVQKNRLPKDALVIILGGPAMLIGLGGGAASSMQTGKSSEDLEFASVQRANAELERRAQEVINFCWSKGLDNPIVSIHDVGAGGLSNALPELVHDSDRGAVFELRNIPNAESGMSPMEIWCNESQERYVLGISAKDLPEFQKACRRERCPFAVVGKTTAKQQIVVHDEIYNNNPVDLPMDVLFGKPPKMTRQFSYTLKKPIQIDTSNIELSEAVKRIMNFPAVGSKKFLITIGDRNVGGLTVRDQMVGPWQVPVSDLAVTSSGFKSQTGEAMAMGERTPLAAIDPAASARMAVGETITNMVAADIAKLPDIKFSANWMAAAGYDHEDQSLFEAVKAVGEDFCPALGITVPVGKDSLSMRTVWEEKGASKSVASPLSLIITGFAPVREVRKTLTPELKNIKDSCLILIDLGNSKNRLGGSSLAQVYRKIGGVVPDVDPKPLKGFFKSITELNRSGRILAYHDRSDGGLFTTLSEMMFASRLGINVDISTLGNDILASLFNEELGAVIQVRNKDLGSVLRLLNSAAGNNVHEIGTVCPEQELKIYSKNRNIYSNSRAQLESWWAKTSYEVQSLRDNPATAKSEYRLIEDIGDKGISPQITFRPTKKKFAKRPRVAILREQGVNGHVEMAAAFDLAGFSSVDVHLSDISSGKVSLSDFVGLVVCGGFSYGDVLGAGEGWAKSILFNPDLRSDFKKFFERKDTFSLGVCNGCQMLSTLKEIIPGSEHWPKFKDNVSERFEARLVSVEIKKTPSIFFKGMEGSILPIPVAHGEGKAEFTNNSILAQTLSGNLIPLQYVDNGGKVTEQYPLNPNGSKFGVASLTTTDGRATILMPHPERAFLTNQFSWHPEGWKDEGPWLQMFRNARAWVGEK